MQRNWLVLHTSLITHLHEDVAEAKDNLIQAKVFQAHFANQNRSPDHPFQVSDKVMLSTFHWHHEFKKKGEQRATKFFPHYNTPYNIIDAHPQTSNYTLELLDSLNTYLTYHTSKLRPFTPNDSALFPSHKLSQPCPIITADELEEFFVQEIIDFRQYGKGWQYLIHWTGYGPKHNCWQAGSALNECEALDIWLNKELWEQA
jgi:hypothetical protein